MIPGAARLASENLVRTYFELGLAAPGARALVEDGYRACIGSMSHPICNFAVELNLDPWSCRQLRELAESRSAFQVYRLPTDEPSHVHGLLRGAGFDPSYELTMMVASGSASDPACVRSAYGDQRTKLARFMADQFFLRQPPNFRAEIAEITAASPCLDLHYVERDYRIVAGVMLCRGNGVCGLYNLCVASAYRERGLGASLVRWVLSEAHEAGECVILQCDTRLEPWYRSLGFASCGKVEVFCLAQPR